MPEFHLVVTQAWGDYARGDRITQPADVAATLAGEHVHHVNKIMAPDAYTAADNTHSEA